MKIIAQNYRDGQLQLLEVPMISSRRGLLVETRASLVSVGTEKAMMDVAKKSLLGKALARPDWVKQVIDKVKTEGLFEAWRQSKARLDMPVPLGYSSAGIVREVHSKNAPFKVGDRVACTGSGYAAHAEFVSVPVSLCAKIPDNVPFEDAAYGALGGIAMEAVRLARVEFGHRVAVIGLGLLGQLATQILKGAGCHVLGVDISSEKCVLAKDHGAERVAVSGTDDAIQAAVDFSEGEGVDAVIIFAATPSNEPLEQAAAMCRERGRIVAAGLVGLDIPRKIFFEKELDLLVSRAWGPGVLDPDYETRNVQWPFAYARWTAQRNLQEFLRMLSLGTINLEKLTTHKFPFEQALEAYKLILSGDVPTIGVVLEYKDQENSHKENAKLDFNVSKPQISPEGKIGIGLIGAGLFARGTLLPAMKGIKDVELRGVATSSGLSAKHIADSYKFLYSTSDYKELLNDKDINLIFILTRHNSHARFVCEALNAGKNVYVEKPLCLTLDELKKTYSCYEKAALNNQLLMIGFERRFSPTAKKAKAFIGDNGPGSVVQIRCNAGFVPKNSWVHHPDEGGGRIIGEVCHFVDLAQFLTGGNPQVVFAACADSAQDTRDNVCVTMQMDNGAAVTITYAANGDKSFPREEVQIFSGGGVFVINNFKDAMRVSGGKKKRWKALEVDRGVKNELKETFEALKAGCSSPIDFHSIVYTTLTTFAIEESIRTGKAVEVGKYLVEIEAK